MTVVETKSELKNGRNILNHLQSNRRETIEYYSDWTITKHNNKLCTFVQIFRKFARCY